MSLTASMWTSVSGLLVHGEKMNVIGNNISNVNTVGFKASRMDFQDFICQDIGTAAGMGQVGRGTSIGIIMNDFSQGSFETTTETTDIAIAGNGFFCVKPMDSNVSYYTRAGNFRFNKDGYLVDPHGYAVQGWEIDNTAASLAATSGTSASSSSSIKGTGVPKDVRLDTFSCDPKHTNSMTMAVNLDSAKGNDKATNDDNPFFSLLELWDATPNSNGEVLPLGTQSYAYQHTLEVFDEGGRAHKLTVYFDRVEQTPDTNIANMEPNEIVWEYVVTMEPSDDMRNFDNPPTPAGEVPDKYKGLLMSGTMVFDSSGQFKDMTSYVPTSSDMNDKSTWHQAPISANGYPMLCPNFSGRDGASSAWDDTISGVNREADGYLIELNLGLRSKSSTWGGNAPATIADWVDTSSTLYKNLTSTNKAGSIIANVNNVTGDYGVVGTDGVVYHPKAAAGTNEVVNSDGVVCEQKKAPGDSLGPTEATDPAGWVYAETADASVTGGVVYYDPAIPTDRFTKDSSGNWFNVGTGVAATPPNVGALVKEPLLTSPVASNRGVADTTSPYNKVDSGGLPIPLTTTYNYYGMGNKADLQKTTSTSYAGKDGKNNFFERFAAQDGYTYGELRGVTVSKDGVLSGSYSNGVTLELYQLTLYDFPSTQNLRREGGNLFTETRESGLHTSGAPGSAGFGTTESNSLEQSNVDLAREFVQMITTQRGFQANSKSVTTVDTMLDTVINMKR